MAVPTQKGISSDHTKYNQQLGHLLDRELLYSDNTCLILGILDKLQGSSGKSRKIKGQRC